jgi:hypothetical protein
MPPPGTRTLHVSLDQGTHRAYDRLISELRIDYDFKTSFTELANALFSRAPTDPESLMVLIEDFRSPPRAPV